MKIAILGADGYYGTPLAQQLSEHHELLLIDNLWHRNLKDSPSLTPLAAFPGKILDVQDFGTLSWQLDLFGPECIIHLAQQRSAPYSQLSHDAKAYTIANNTSTTLNVLEYMKLNKHIRLIHIGSMGVYGYNAHHRLAEGDQVRAPGSIYHATKCFDSTMFEMYSRLYELDITDLHQGIMWGIGGRFDYDALYGTVLNRFIVQDLLGQPVTVYGNGNRERAFIHVNDSIRCIEKVLEIPQDNTYKQYNQFSEIRSINQLAQFFQNRIELDNPRIEVENELYANNTTLARLGAFEKRICHPELELIKATLRPHLDNVSLDLLISKGPEW